MSIDPAIHDIAHEAWHANYTGDLPAHDALIAAVEAAAPYIAARALRDAADRFRNCADYRYRATRMNATEDYLRLTATETIERATVLAKAIADPEGQQLATTAANLATTWGKEWAIQDPEGAYPPGPASSNEGDRAAMLQDLADAKRIGIDMVLVSRVASPWKEERP